MRPRFTALRFTAAAFISVSASLPLAAQQSGDPNADATALMRSCMGLAESKKLADAAAGGRQAESLFRARLARAPRDVEAMVGLARVLSQCELPSAEMIAQGELSAQAIELLENALALDPTHWTARFVLASINFRSPAFLGRAPRAASELDILLAQQGDRTENPRFARVFELRGILHSRAGNADSARAVWMRGARLFPADSTLVDLARRAAAPTAAPAQAAPPTSLNTVNVVARSAPPAIAASTREIGKAGILSAAGGAADVLQAVQLQPGATRVAEGSDIYTRGGDPAETALLVDGGRIASLSRFEGLSGGMFGAIEPFVVRAVRYSSGGFSVRNGNALSGVVDIETDGRPRERSMRAGVSLVQAGGTLRAPLSKTSGLWVNARASQTAALLATHGRRDEFQGAPHSEEAIASFIMSPSPSSEVRATAMIEQDDARRMTTAAQWTGPFHASGAAHSLMLSSRWLAPGAPLVVRTNVTAGDRSSDWEFGVLQRRRHEANALAKSDVEYSAGESVMLRAGVEAGLFSRTERGTLPTSMSVALGSPLRVLDAARATARQLGGYSEFQLSHDATIATVGLRADLLPGETHATLDPRFNVATTRGEWTARVALGVFHQGRWRYAPVIPDSLTPSGLAGRATHVVAGIERTTESGSVQIEAFDKRYGDYAQFGQGAAIQSSRARGVDMVATHKAGERFNGSLGYSWLDARLQLVDGRIVSSPFDVTHALTAMLTTKLTTDWSLGETVRYGTGAPYASHDANATLTSMTTRLPSYGRVDLRVMRYIRQPKYLLTSFVEVINVTNRRNVNGVTWDAATQRELPTHSFFASRTIVAGGEFQFR